jgi:hypothetical protein
VKIGKTMNLKQRIQSLNNPTCLPFSFRPYAIYKVGDDMDMVEKTIHSMIDRIDYDLRAREEVDSSRLREREFFALDAEKAFEFLRDIAILRKDEHNLEKIKQTKQEMAEEKVAKSVEERAEKQKRLSFTEYGIPIGSKIAFVDNAAITATVVNEKQVEFEGVLYSLSALAAKLLIKYRGRRSDTAAQGPLYFTYNGKKISELRNKV